VRVADRSAPTVTAVEIEPSTAARRRALTQREGSAAALGSAAVVCTVDGIRDYRWLAVANVAMMVRVHAPATAADRSFVERLSAALTAAAASGP
jgi:hypothetical protein